jgi:hypothetical protein
MGIENSLLYILRRKLEKEAGPGILTLSPIAEREITAHVAAQAGPEDRQLIAWETAVLIVQKLRLWKVPPYKPIRVKWIHLRPELNKVSEWNGYPVPKPR